MNHMWFKNVPPSLHTLIDSNEILIQSKSEYACTKLIGLESVRYMKTKVKPCASDFSSIYKMVYNKASYFNKH